MPPRRRDLSHTAGRLARRWAHAYTAGLPDHLRRRRLAEIDNDVWEQREREGEAAGVGALIMLRTLKSIPTDLLWRIEASQEVRMTGRTGTSGNRIASRPRSG